MDQNVVSSTFCKAGGYSRPKGDGPDYEWSATARDGGELAAPECKGST